MKKIYLLMLLLATVFVACSDDDDDDNGNGNGDEKGWVVTIKHALRNALIPIITIAGSDLGNILTGSVLVESVFSIPGIGKMLVDSINTRDLPIVQGGVMYIAVICVIMYLVVDLLYTVVDPRIRLGKESS